MCSSVFGPAMPPPFVTCPTTKIAVPSSFAARIRRAAHSRTCPTLPGAPSSSSVCTVWIESTIAIVGRVASRCARMVSRCVSGRNSTSPAPSPSRSARSFTCSGLSSPLTYSAACPSPCSRATTCSSSVDLPMPGSPPTSTMLPGTMPPPSTKSNSASPVFRRVDSVPLTALSFAARVATMPRRCETAGRPTVFAGARSTISSTSVDHSPHDSQRPPHFGYSAPQFVQRYAVFVLALTRSAYAWRNSRIACTACGRTAAPCRSVRCAACR